MLARPQHHGGGVVAVAAVAFLITFACNAAFLPAGFARLLAGTFRLLAGFAVASSPAVDRVRVAAPVAALLLSLASAVIFQAPLPPLPALLPSLALCGFAWPSMRAVLPHARAPRSSHLQALGVSLATALFASVYTRPDGALAGASGDATSVPSTGVFLTLSWNSATLFDAQVYIPFFARVPAFVSGVSLARVATSMPARPLAFLCAATMLSALAFLVPARFSFLLEALLLVPVSFLLVALNQLVGLWTSYGSSTIPESSPVSSSPPQRPSSVEITAYLLIAGYALQNSVWLVISRLVCSPHASLCTSPVEGWLDRSHDSSTDQRPPVALVIVGLVLSASAVGLFLLKPIVSTIVSFHSQRRVFPHHRDSVPASLSQPQRPALPLYEKGVRLIGFYTGVIVFTALVWKLSWPAGLYESSGQNLRPPRLLCVITHALYPHCESSTDVLSSQDGLAGSRLLRSVFSFFLDSLRWLSVVCIPALVLNCIGQLAFPYVVLRELPSVEQMIAPFPEDAQQDDEDVSSLLSREVVDMESDLFDSGKPSRREVAGDLEVPEDLVPGTHQETCVLVEGRVQRLDVDFVLYVRIVTRGNNPDLVAGNARRAACVLLSSGLPRSRFVVEIVTDKSLSMNPKLATEFQICEILVPDAYQTQSGAMYKARALNYAIELSPARDFDWIVHLDEETQFDEDTVSAMMLHCGRETHACRVAKTQVLPSIGQGPIMYGKAMVPGFSAASQATLDRSDSLLSFDDSSGKFLRDVVMTEGYIDERNLGSDEDTEVARLAKLECEASPSGSWLATLADSSRVADDLGRYRLQYELGEVWFGMHGSFVVAANRVEKMITFDHGIDGSIAEDAFFAMLARSEGTRFRWIDAFMYEQSPFRVLDFMKQRARWLVGGFRVCLSHRIPIFVRGAMLFLTCIWALMPFTYLALIVSIGLGHVGADNPANAWYYHVMLPLMAAISIWGYVYGFLVTFTPRDLGWSHYLTMLYIQMTFIPVFGLMEVGSVTYALWNFSSLSSVFHVVQKQASMPPKIEIIPPRDSRPGIGERTLLLPAS